MMKKRWIHRIILFVMAALMLPALLPPITARAVNDDFTMTYAFYPGGLGYLGGDTRLILHVTNNGATNIDKVDAVINLKAGFSERWTGTIAPSEEKKIVFDGIHFSKDDVNVARILQVAINNDGDANPDGVQMVGFTMGGAGELWNYSFNIPPSGPTLHPGDTLRCVYVITNINTADGMNLEHVNVSPIINLSGEADDHFLPSQDLGSIGPGETATYSFSYMLTEDDITGRLLVWCNVKCSLAGIAYAHDDYSSAYTVEEAPRPTERPAATHTEAPATATVSTAPAMESSAPSPTLTETPTPSPALTPSYAPRLSPAASPSLTPSATAVRTRPPPDISTTILLIVIVVLVLAIAALGVLLLIKREKK